MTTRLYRSITDKKIFGVCGGLGQALNVDPTLLRFILVVATIFSGGTAGLLYIVAGIVIPEEPAGFHHDHAYGYGHSTSGSRNGSFWGSSCSKHKKPHQTSYTGHESGSSYMGGASSHTMNGGMRTGSYTGSSGHMSHTGSTTHTNEQQAADELDALMREVEAKALRKEIEELKQRLARFEKNDDHVKGDN